MSQFIGISIGNRIKQSCTFRKWTIKTELHFPKVNNKNGVTLSEGERMITGRVLSRFSCTCIFLLNYTRIVFSLTRRIMNFRFLSKWTRYDSVYNLTIVFRTNHNSVLIPKEKKYSEDNYVICNYHLPRKCNQFIFWFLFTYWGIFY